MLLRIFWGRLGIKQGTDSLDQLGTRGVCLGNNVRDAELPRLVHQLRMQVQGEHQDVSAGCDGLDGASGVESVHNRHREIEENHIGAEFLHPLDRHLAIFGFSAYHPIRFLFQVEPD